MSERELVSALRRLGLRRGDTLLVHASLRSLTPVPERAAVLYRALREVLGPEGTLVVPAFTPGNSRSSNAYRAAVRTMTWVERIGYHRTMPSFDPVTTASEVGKFSEFVRTSENSVRSAHPQTSFAAVGPCADFLMAEHALTCHLGEDSPLARLYAQGAHVLLVGVGYSSCSSFHLAEYRYRPDPPIQTYRAVVLEGGRRRWRRFMDVRLDDSDFVRIGSDMEQEISVSRATVLGSDIRFFSLPAAVDFTERWLGKYR